MAGGRSQFTRGKTYRQIVNGGLPMVPAYGAQGDDSEIINPNSEELTDAEGNEEAGREEDSQGNEEAELLSIAQGSSPYDQASSLDDTDPLAGEELIDKHNEGTKDDEHSPSFARLIVTKASRNLVEMMSAIGVPMRTIAASIPKPDGTMGISVITLNKHFKTELDTGLAKANVQVASKLFLAAANCVEQIEEDYKDPTTGNWTKRKKMKIHAAGVHAAEFWLRARGGFRTAGDLDIEALWEQFREYQLESENMNDISKEELQSRLMDKLRGPSNVSGSKNGSSGRSSRN